ncbi:MAG: GNAT family N-acetyltransferase [Sandaracinaceae bacterium]
MERRLRLRESLPDTPCFVEARDLLAWEGSAVAGELGAFVVWSEEDDLAVVVGSPPPDAVRSATAQCSEIVLLQEPPLDWGPLLDFDTEGATVLIEARPWSFPRGVTRWLDPSEFRAAGPLSHVPPSLLDELRDAMEDDRPVMASFDGRTPVAFAYAASETETLYDVSIDTLASHRRRGFASAAMEGLAETMARRGKRAVWGAADSDPGSLALARSLGCVEVGRLWVASRR